MSADRLRVLLDERVPERLRTAFSADFPVETVRCRGWTGLRNGDLLRAAEEPFDALVTVDKRLRFQRNVASRQLAVVVLDAARTTIDDLNPLVPATEAALRVARPGTVTVVP